MKHKVKVTRVAPTAPKVYTVAEVEEFETRALREAVAAARELGLEGVELPGGKAQIGTVAKVLETRGAVLNDGRATYRVTRNGGPEFAPDLRDEMADWEAEKLADWLKDNAGRTEAPSWTGA